jgi:hypothetical protein
MSRRYMGEKPAKAAREGIELHFVVFPMLNACSCRSHIAKLTTRAREISIAIANGGAGYESKPGDSIDS